MQAHPIGGVIMDVAAFKVSHSARSDPDNTALQAARARSSSIGAMERYTWVRFARKLTTCHIAHSKGQHSSGAMDESSGKGSKMQAHISSGVVMDIAAVKVSHAIGVDKDATALQAKKWSA